MCRSLSQLHNVHHVSAVFLQFRTNFWIIITRFSQSKFWKMATRGNYLIYAKVEIYLRKINAKCKCVALQCIDAATHRCIDVSAQCRADVSWHLHPRENIMQEDTHRLYSFSSAYTLFSSVNVAVDSFFALLWIAPGCLQWCQFPCSCG